MHHQRVVLAILALIIAPAPLPAAPRINEFVADNRTDFTDEDGDLSDWIEIHNPSSANVSLQGWSLTDDAETPQKWIFPNQISLAPDSYLIVFASGKDRQEGDALHSNFRLDRDGEFLALYDAAGNAASEFAPFPKATLHTSYGYDASAELYREWRQATPGTANQEPSTLGPALLAPETRSPLAQESEDFILSVRVLATSHPVESVRLRSRTSHKSEIGVALQDDGLPPDTVAGDGRYSGSISAQSLFGPRFQRGDLLRWAFEATDSEGNTARLPEIQEDVIAQPEYFGTLVEDPSIDSELPILHWFTDNPESATSTSGHRASVFFQGQFYDNVFVKRRGQSGAISWPKPKLKFDFNPRDHFLYDAERRRVEEFNLQSHFADASFMRENVAFAFFNEIGTPASDTRHWHVRMNGDYYGLFSYVEQVDEDFLRQQGLDPNGALYKANGFPATLARGVTSALYQKDTRKDEPYDDLIAFTEGINGDDRFHYIMDHVNLPAMVNEMAGQSIIRNADRLTKNYYMYRDPMTDLWQRIPWDMDGAFGTSSALGTENYASPLYGDSEHTQAPGQPIYQNFLLDAVLDHHLTQQMYLRRLRTLIDTYLTEEPVYFRSQVDSRLEQIRLEAQADRSAWGTGNILTGAETIRETALTLRRTELLETFGSKLIPKSPSPGLDLVIGEVAANPADAPDAEYFQIVNPHREAIDLSGWEVRGAVSIVLPPGTVLPAKGNIFSPNDGILHLVHDVRAFRKHSGSQGLFFVGPYDGRLAAEGETILIHDTQGERILEHTYRGVTNNYASWVKSQFSDEDQLDPQITDWAADPFGLGLSNLSRYAFPNGPHLRMESAYQLAYERRADAADLQFILETSTDLSNWAPLEPLNAEVHERDDDHETILLTLEESPTGYFRIRTVLSR